MTTTTTRATGRLLAAGMMLIAAGAATAQQHGPMWDHATGPVISVNGRGTTQATPDRAIVRFGAVAESEEAAAAQAQVNEIMQRAIDAVTDEGVEEKHLATSNLVLEPVYESRRKPDGVTIPTIRGYRASYTLTVTVDDIEKAGDVIDAGLASGINQFHGVQFTLKDDTEARVAALKKASEDAKTKAQAIADAMGVQLVRIKRITESGDYFPPPQPMYQVRAMAMEADMATPMQAGELTLGANVTVEWEIE